jgi:aryl-alcohol dehydrogenase-like predicted oxidoreductase
VTPRLALGAAQFGLDYGVSNRLGRPSQPELAEILDAAQAAGVRLIDTAPLYGDSEAALGAAGAAAAPFLIATKTPAFGERPDPDLLEATLRHSLARLGASRIEALLVHHGWNLLRPGGERLFARMEELKRQGLVRRIGASVYEPEELATLLARFPLEIVQAPANALDQRFVRSGLLGEARSRGALVCLRSAFLQGLLLMRPGELDGARAAAVARFQAQAAEAGLSPLAAALAYARGLDADHIVVGANRRRELDDIWEAFAAAIPAGADWRELACEDPEVIDPRRWPTRAAA